MKKIILITGANRGIGLGICKGLASSGNKVILGSRNLEKGKLAAANLSGDIEVIKLDITLKEDIKKAVTYIDESFGRLDVLVNNAAILGKGTRSFHADIEEVKTVMETNFYGTWQLTIDLIPLLLKSSDPRIINMSSGMGALHNLTGGFSGYRFSKSSLNALTIQLSNELKNKIKINAVNPGWVKTDMGGHGAPRSIEQGADTVIWLAQEASGEHNGKFFKDRVQIPW